MKNILHFITHKKINTKYKHEKSYMRHKDFRFPSVTIVLPPLDSKTGWAGELWLKTTLLNWQN